MKFIIGDILIITGWATIFTVITSTIDVVLFKNNIPLAKFRSDLRSNIVTSLLILIGRCMDN